MAATTISQHLAGEASHGADRNLRSARIITRDQRTLPRRRRSLRRGRAPPQLGADHPENSQRTLIARTSGALARIVRCCFECWGPLPGSFVTVGGRILDVFMELYAITVIATLAGAIGSFVQKRGQEIDEKG